MDRGAWYATYHGVIKSWAQLNTHKHLYNKKYSKFPWVKKSLQKVL